MDYPWTILDGLFIGKMSDVSTVSHLRGKTFKLFTLSPIHERKARWNWIPPPPSQWLEFLNYALRLATRNPYWSSIVEPVSKNNSDYIGIPSKYREIPYEVGCRLCMPISTNWYQADTVSQLVSINVSTTGITTLYTAVYGEFPRNISKNSVCVCCSHSARISRIE